MLEDNFIIDNRLINLQLVTPRENNSKDQWRHNRSSKYVGVAWKKCTNRWVSMIGISNDRIFLGYFTDEDEAGEMYQLALENIELYNGDAKQFREQIRNKQINR